MLEMKLLIVTMGMCSSGGIFGRCWLKNLGLRIMDLRRVRKLAGGFDEG